MAPLATQTDLAARIGPLQPGQQVRADALILDASALVRGYTRQDFDLVTDDTVELRSQGRVITLPQRPVIDVTGVVAIGVPPTADLTLPVGTWAFDGIDRIEIQTDIGWIINLPAVWDRWDWAGTSSYRVTYSHGYATVPDDVVAVVCNMVNRVLTAPTLADGLTQETIGQYGYQTQQAVGTQGSGVRLTTDDRMRLRRYRRTAHTIETPVR